MVDTIQVGLIHEVGTADVRVICTPTTTWYGDVSVEDLRSHHGGCNHVSKGQSPDCVAAIHRWLIYCY